MSETKKLNKKKILSIIASCFLYLFLIFAFLILIITIASKKDSDGTATIFNRQARIVTSSSMEQCNETDVSKYKIKSIKVKTMVFIKTIPNDEDKKEAFYNSLQIGDVLTFKYVYTTQVTITHRIIDINKITNGYQITLRGDNVTESTSTQIINTSIDSQNYVIGKVTSTNYFLGCLVTAIKQPIGLTCIIILPCSLIIISEVIKIINTISKAQKEKQKQEIKEKEDEVNELKKKLEMLEGKENIK